MALRPRTICLILLLLAWFPCTALAAQDSLIFYILDGSGSMWGRADGKIKIQAAKEVMSTLIQETPDDLQVGVMVYGHRRKGDCSDIEILEPIGPLDKWEAVSKVRGITPKGKTPISESLTLAVDAVKKSGSAGTVVLVSDGIETCGADPCAVARKLKESGVNFVLHVVGLDVSGEAAEQLACIAKAGGGLYFSTSNATDLLDALNRIKQSVVEKKAIEASKEEAAPPLEPIVQNVTGKSTSIRIKASGPGTVSLKHDAWLETPYYWKLIDPETGEERARFRGLEDQLVPPGEYQLVWRQSEHGSREVALGEVITVEPRKTSEVFVKTGIRAAVPTWVKPPRFWGLQDRATQEMVATFVPLITYPAPSGQYDLVWRQNEHDTTTVNLMKVTIEPDRVTEARLATALNPVPAGWVPERLRFWELQDPESGKQLARFRWNWDPQLVPPGTYRVVYRQDEHASSNSDLGLVTVEAGKMNEFPVNTGVKLVPRPGMTPPYRIEFIELDGKGEPARTVSLSDSFNAMPLKPGTYRIDYRQKQHEGSTLTLVDSFELPAGALVEIEL